MNFKDYIGKKIKKRRKQLGFKTQKDLAAALGTDESRVSRWESGQNIPDRTFKKVICKVLKVDMQFFESIENNDEDASNKSTPELISSIITLLPALSQTELSLILSTTRNLIKVRPTRPKNHDNL